MQNSKTLSVCHYWLGLEPYRSGGTVVFLESLLKRQFDEGQRVSFLFPGHFSFGKKTKIVKSKLYKRSYPVFEIINPIPIPLLNGIKDPKLFTKCYDNTVFEDFFQKYHFDVVHVHTLMGLDSSFFRICKKHGIKTVFTAHDIFGICPKISSEIVPWGFCDYHPSELCSLCCQNAFSYSQMRLMNSSLYLKNKNNPVVRWARSRKRDSLRKETNNSRPNLEELRQIKNHDNRGYQELQNHYLEMLMAFDLIHFNSKHTKDFFFRFVQPKNYIVRWIGHNGILKLRNISPHAFDSERLVFVYLGAAKGLDGLISCLKTISEGKNNFVLEIHTNDRCSDASFIKKYPGYSPNGLGKILAGADLLLLPSDNFETLSFIVLEAIAAGVPCLVSESVGAKEIVEEYDAGYVVNLYDGSLEKVLRGIIENPQSLERKKKGAQKADLSFANDSLTDLYHILLNRKAEITDE